MPSSKAKYSYSIKRGANPGGGSGSSGMNMTTNRDYSVNLSVQQVLSLWVQGTTLQHFTEMWYWVFLWCLFSSLFVHGAVGLLMLVMLQRHKRGRLITLVLVSVGFLASLSGSVITSKSIPLHHPLFFIFFGLRLTSIELSIQRVPIPLLDKVKEELKKSGQLDELVRNCKTCIKERGNPVEPLMSSELPERPWQKEGSDLFTLNHDNYLLVVDYYSRYVEIAKLTPTRSQDVIVHLKSIFSRHGVPENFFSDNGPQYSSQQFKDFAVAYGFKHVTSSPRFAQSNGEAERHVQTAKQLLKKAKDPYLALLAYRATPLANGYSPAQLLMGRRLRTPVPQHPSLLTPELPDSTVVAAKERERRAKDTANYNKRHRVRDLSQLTPGQPVWITDTKSQGTVVSSHSAPRSYIVDGPSGTIRRNRHHLVPFPETVPHTPHTPTPSTPPQPVGAAALREDSEQPSIPLCHR
nr:PREDICTED: transmembrane protein 170B [Notothenia coriiceps]